MVKIFSIFNLLLFTILLGCSHYKSGKPDGRITFHSKGNEKLFIFSIDMGSDYEENFHFMERKVKISPKNLEILKKILIKDSYCLNQGNHPAFEIISLQKTSYDKTFYRSIMQVHRFSGNKILFYFGRCLEKN